MNRFAIRHPRLDEVEMKAEPPPKTLRDHFEMQFALRGNDRLVQLRIDAENKSRIFVVQRREPRGQFVLFTLRLELQRGVNVRTRIFRHGKFQRMIRAHSVSPVCVFLSFTVAPKSPAPRRDTGSRVWPLSRKICPMRSVTLRLALNKSLPVVICPE